MASKQPASASGLATIETSWQHSEWHYPPEYIVSLGSRPTYYAAPTIDKLQVTGETAKQVKVLGHRNRYQHKVFCLPNDNVEATWKEISRLQEALDIALFRVAAKLKQFGHYPDRLAEYETFEEAPNPLSASVINASNPDDERDYEYGLPWEEHSYFLHARRQVVLRHTAQMLRYIAKGEKIDGTGTYEEESLTGQKGWFLCPTDAAWEEYESLRQTALKEALELHQFLLPLGTYEQVREDAAVHALRASDPVIERVEAPKAELVNAGEGLSGADAEKVQWSEAVVESAATATVILALDRDSEQPEENEPVASPHTPLSIRTEPSSAPILVDPNTMLLDLPVLSSTPVWIDPSLVRLDLGTQPRAGGMLDKLLKRYAKEMKTELWNWQSAIPTVLFDGRHYFPNGSGHHRLGAAVLAEKQILVYLKQGTIADAKLEAAKGEQQHSEGRTNKDKRNQVRMVLTDPEVLERLEAVLGHPGSFPSDRAIAEYCRVTPPTVASVIAELVEEGLLSLPEERVGKDGRVQKTKNIGKKAAEGDEDSGDEDAAPERSERKRFSKLYKEFGGARELAIEILSDLSASDLNALTEAIQARLDDDGE